MRGTLRAQEVRMRLVLGLTLAIALGCTGAGTDQAQQAAPAGGTEAAAAVVAAPAAGAPDADDGLVDAAAEFNGGRELDEAGEVDVNHAVTIIDRTPDAEWHCSKDQRCDVILEFNEPFDLEKLVFRGAKDPSIAVRELAVDTGPSREGPWTEVTKVSLAQTADAQTFPLAAKGVRYAKLRPLSTHVAESEYYGIDDVELRGKRSEKRAYDWNGTWTTLANNFLLLKQEGDRVTGCHADQDRLEGTVDGAVFTGVFHDVDGENVTDHRIVLAITPERAIHGVMSDDMTPGAPLSNRFDGVANAEAVDVNCDAPVEEQPDELEQALAKDGRVALYGVLFDFDKDTLKPESAKVLGALAKTIQAKPDRTYRIEGHTDDKGGEAYNQDLSERRANAVKAWLVKNGCPEDKLVGQGYGASSPVLPNDTAAGRAANRRVEVAIVE